MIIRNEQSILIETVVKEIPNEKEVYDNIHEEILKLYGTNKTPTLTKIKDILFLNGHKAQLLQDLIDKEEKIKDIYNNIELDNIMVSGKEPECKVWAYVNMHMDKIWRRFINEAKEKGEDYSIWYELIYKVGTTIKDSINTDEVQFNKAVTLMTMMIESRFGITSMFRRMLAEIPKGDYDYETIFKPLNQLTDQLSRSNFRGVYSNLECVSEHGEVISLFPEFLEGYRQGLGKSVNVVEDTPLQLKDLMDARVISLIHDTKFNFEEFLKKFSYPLKRVDKLDLLEIQRKGHFDALYKADDSFMNYIPLGKKTEDGKDNYYILFKPNMGDDRHKIFSYNIENIKDEVKPGAKITILQKKERNDYNMEKVIESISVDKDGTLKVVIEKNQTYMDLYMENHRMLEAARKADNLDSMKKGVAVSFALINAIEQDRFYKEDKDKVKARMFLINDFKTYMKYISERDPKFDFSKYYAEQDYGKVVINVTPETIAGIKKLVTALLL